MARRDDTRNTERAAAAAPSVLVVEDNRPNRILIEAMLEALGCRVELAASGPEALEIAGRAVFDMVLMDIHMPKMDGLETLRRLRDGNGPNAVTPVAALTANAFEDDHRSFHEAGVAAVLVKPVSSARLAAVINECVAAGPGPAPTPEPPTNPAA